MANITLSALVSALTPQCKDALEAAAVLCANRGMSEITIESYIETLLPSDDMQNILNQFDCNQNTLIEMLQKSSEISTQSGVRPTFSAQLYQLLQEAYLVATLEMQVLNINTGILVLTLLKHSSKYGLLSFYKEISHISIEQLQALLAGLNEENAPHTNAANNIKENQFIEKFTIDFTAQAKQGKIDPVFARNAEIRLMIDILARRRKNNPILVGEPGVGKTAAIEGLALRIVNNNVPSVLKDVRIVGLDMASLQAGASVKGEFEKRLKGVIDEIKASPIPTILFIDEAHTLIGSGNQSGGSDGANLLKPALARGEMRTIAATTWSEYKKYFEKDAALARRFQLVKMNEPSPEETTTILRGIAPHYEKSHGVYICDDAIIKTAELAGRYITGRFLPDKAIDVLDTACARVKVSLGATPNILEELEEEEAVISRELEAIKRDLSKNIISNSAEFQVRYNSLEIRRLEILLQIEKIKLRWQEEKELVEMIINYKQETNNIQEQDKEQKDTKKEKETKKEKTTPKDMVKSLENLCKELKILQGDEPLIHYQVTPELVSTIVSEWTGIPKGKLQGSGTIGLDTLEEKLEQRIKGQEYALQSISKSIITSHAGLESPTRPTGIFLLVGPSGVGKTETALALAEELFGGERMLVTINMSEFQEKHTVSRLIGSPPGYVGYGEGGRLTEAIRKQPYSIVLFDEVEKAHPDILNLFYQVFDKGMLADGEGREIDFRNTLIILTSNLGSDIVSAMFEDEDDSPSAITVRNTILPVLTQFFRPALLGRMTIVPYLPISKDILKKLVHMKLNIITERLKERHNIDLEWEEKVALNIVESCSVVDTGARNIDHIIQSNLLPQIAITVLSLISQNTNKKTRLYISIDTDSQEFICTLRDSV